MTARATSVTTPMPMRSATSPRLTPVMEPNRIAKACVAKRG